MNRGIIELNKKFTTNEGSGITLTNSETKNMKVISSLGNREILLKGTARKIISQEGGFLNFVRPLMAAGLPLMRNVLTPLAKIVVIPLGLTAAASATDTAIQKKNVGSGMKEMEESIKIVKSLEKSGLLIKGVSETIKNETEQKGGFLDMLLVTLGNGILGSLLTVKGVIRGGDDADYELFCVMLDWLKVFSLISSWDHFLRSSSLRIPDTLHAGYEPVQTLSSGLVDWSCALVITTTLWCHWQSYSSGWRSD